VIGDLLNNIIQAIRNRDYILSAHYWEDRAGQSSRPLPSSIVASIGNNEPEVIEHYPNDHRGASCLILGKNGKGNFIHSFIGYSVHPIKICTAYYPDRSVWINNRERRR